VKDRNVNMDIEELFRNKLENSEINPGETIRSELMRRVGRKEFMHFNPARFNVYYLGGLIAVGITATYLLISLPGKDNKTELKPGKETIIKVDTTSTDTGMIDQEPGLFVIDKHETGQSSERVSNSNSKNETESGTVLKKEGNVNSSRTHNATPEPVEKTDLIKDNLPEKTDGYTLLKKPVPAFDVSSTSGCIPLQVRFVNNSLYYDSCRWTFGDGGYSTETNPQWIFDAEGEYRIQLTSYGEGGYEATASQIINVYSKPVARYEINPENPIIPDDEIRFINYSLDAVRYKWEFGDGTTSQSFEPSHKYSKYDSYDIRLIVWSEHGCSDSLFVRDAFASSGCYINFPNAFIPNTDGPAGGYYSYKSDEAAQIFHPVTSGVSEYQLRIFSKIGVLIFESNDISIGWDGYHKGQLCEPGVYIWKVRGTFKNGEPFVKMGDVTLLKR
jgi:PKD repeat protein